MQSKSNVKVTVVVPVHNSEMYLRQCLESALAQTLRDMEIICIDSSDTDRGFQIIAQMKEQDNRIIYINNPVTSYGYKINTGIELAEGDYIAILETDDQMSPNMLEKLYAIGNSCCADVVNSDYFQFFEHKGRKYWEIRKLYSNLQMYNQLINYTAETPKTIAVNGIWTALYRREFLLMNNIRLNESPGAAYQDASFLFLTGLSAESVYHLDEPLYWYRIDNAGSSMKDNKKIFEVADEYKFLKRELITRKVKNISVWDSFYHEKYVAFYWNYCRLSEESRELFLQKYLEELRDDIAIGALSRETSDEAVYRRTFLLMDDPDQFKEIVNEADKHRSIMTMGKTLERLEGREVVVFGAGKLGAQVIDILRQNENRIMRICDNNEKLYGTTLAGLEIGSVAETVKLFPNACYLIINRKHSEEMKTQLLAEGISDENIEIFK